MKKKLLLTLVSAFALFAISSIVPNKISAACYQVLGNLPIELNAFNAGLCFGSQLGGGTCTLCADVRFACNPSSECSAHGGTVEQALSQAPIKALCLGSNEAAPLWYDPKVCTFAAKVMDLNNPNEIFGERYTYAQVNWIINSIATHFLNMMGKIIVSFILPGSSSLFGDARTMQLAQHPHSPVAYIQDVSHILQNQPVSGVGQVNATLQKFDLATPAHAQTGGFGFGQLNGIQTLWAASRNTAYIIMIILLLASGFAIMFRLKINPQTAISLQLMIPKIIITLLGVTFSYAIAGFVIDGIYVLISFAIYTFGNAAGNIFPNPALLINIIIYNPLQMFGIIILSGVDSIFSGGALTTILGPIIAILLIIILLVLIVKVWIMLIKTYVMMIIKIILGPWQIMLGLLPGGGGIGAWLRNLIADASVFVVIPLMVVFTLVLWTPEATALEKILTTLLNGLPASSIQPIIDSLTLVKPIPIGDLPQLPILNGLLSFGGGLFRLIFGFAILSLIPKSAEMIQAALKVPPFKYGTAFGEAMGPATGIAKAGFGGYVMPAAAGAVLDNLPASGRGTGAIRNVLQGAYDYGVNRKLWSPARGTGSATAQSTPTPTSFYPPQPKTTP